jgi:tetratricopeptide (TPR) repeat protein
MAQNLAEGPAKRLRQLRLQTTYGYALLHSRGQTSAQTKAAFARARELASATDDAAERASIYWAMWVISYARTELDSMQELANAMLKDSQRSPESLEAGIAHQVFGVTRWFAGDYLSARVHLEQALTAYSFERDHHLVTRFGFDPGVFTMFVLGRVLWPLGEMDRAVHLSEQGLSLALQTAHLPSMAFARFASCFFAALRRKPDQAMPHAEALVAFAREHDLPQWLAYGTCCLGWALWCAGDRQGDLKMREGLELLREQQVHNNLRLFYVLLAEIEADSDRLEAGLATLNAQHEAIEKSGERWFHAEVHRTRGELLLRDSSDNLDAAETAFRRAIEIARNQQTRTFELRSALALAKLYQATGRAEAVRELLSPAVADFIEGPELPEVEQANRLLADLAKRADSTEMTKVTSQTHP